MPMPRSSVSVTGWNGGGDVVYSAGAVNGYAALVDTILEYVPELTWPAAGDVLNQMRNDGQLAGSLKAYTLPIRRAWWALDPDGCRPSVVKLISEDLGLPVIGRDPKPTGARRRNVTWSEHLRVSLLDAVFGHMPFEQVYDTSTGQARLARLDERMPRSIQRIYVDGDGQIDYVEQLPVAGQFEPPTIQANALVWYVNEREGLNWRGRSLMRPAYPYWQIKNLMLRVHAAFNKKAGMGVPYAKVPNGAPPSVQIAAETMIQNYTAADNAGLTLPEGVEAGIAGITGSTPDTLAFVKYLDTQMSVSFLTQWMNLGVSETGNRALAQVFVDMFMQSIQDYADQHADQATRQIVVPLVNVNFGDDEPAPRIVCGNVGADHAVTAAAINELYQFGALTWDPDLENHLRELYKLPARPADAPLPPALAASAPTPPEAP